MSTPDPRGAPSPFSEEEVAAATAPPGDSELDELEAATIDAPDAEAEAPFERIQARARKLSAEQVRAVVESVLFVASQPLTVDQLYEATGVDRERLQAALDELLRRHAGPEVGIVLHEVAEGYQLRTAPESAEWVRRYLKVKPQRLTRAAVETLAIIAYRQPVTRPEIEEIRGVDSGAVLKALLDRRLIKIVGKRDEVGRPILYATTKEFLEFFALKSLNALPTLREFQELTEEHRALVDREAPPIAGSLESLVDKDFSRRLAAQDAASEAALAELERALQTAEATGQAVAQALEPQGPSGQQSGGGQ